MAEDDVSGVAPDRRAEVLRRAEIVRRYVGLEKPTEDDDRQFAAELGLSVDSLSRLAAAWRLHRDPRSLQGANTKLSSEDIAAALSAARGDLDLTGVHPSRRGQTLRRIDAIRQYLEIQVPSRSDRLAAAAAMGVAPERFAKIFRSWMMHRSPVAIPGAKVARRAWRKRPAERDRVQVLLRQVMDDLGVDASVVKMRLCLENLCEQEGIKPPAKSSVYEWVRLMRLQSQNHADS